MRLSEFAGVIVCLCMSYPSMAEHFTLEHAAQIVEVTSPQISPDGRRILVTVSRADLINNRYNTELALVEVATKAQRVLTRLAASQARWSPDGTRIAFIRAVDGRGQIFVLPMDGGEAMPVSRAATSVQTFAWRPDGRAFAYVAQEEPAVRDREEKANRSFEADVNYLATSSPISSHLWLVPVEGGASRRLTSGVGSAWGQLRWAPDGTRLAFGYQPGPGPRFYREQTTRVVNLDSGVTTPLSGRPRLDLPVGFSPDGVHVVYSWPRDGRMVNGNELWLAPANGGLGRNLSRDLGTDIDAGVWLADGSGLIVPVDKDTRSALWFQPLDGPARRLDMRDVNLQNYFSISENGKLALIGNEPGRAKEVYVMDSLSSPPRRLTEFNAHVARVTLGKQETFRWRAPDNSQVDGVLTYPPAYTPGRPLPLVLLIHGGGLVSTIGFDVRSQWLASQGWIIFEPNYQGRRRGDGKDVMSGVDRLIQKGIADPDRMAVSGWSQGGYMTVMLLGKYPERWRAGVAGAAVTDHIDQYLFSDIHSNIADDYGGSPFADTRWLKEYRDYAPITYAHRIKAPTLILHNTGDQRVPITESYTLYHLLRYNHVKTKFIAYPLAGHRPVDPIHSRDVNRRWAEWIKEHLEPSK